ncbi:hypothetical protein M0R45_020426 [Rubus argutus]|uniref:Uncharacterized protein n=1 Tax=Rubus argutus TaxID=59490 RepID=A0AAW1XBI9_RUBAR
MGKKVKKKVKAAQREKWIASDSPKNVPQPSNPSIKDDDDGVSVANVRKPCPHIDKGVDLNKLNAKMGLQNLLGVTIVGKAPLIGRGNLLAIDRLRGYFLNFEASAGPLTISLKKLFTETKPEAGLKNVINPRSFFGCLFQGSPISGLSSAR